MPFTFAHPAIVLPLYRLRRYFSLTGLIIGSMSPDFEYFLRMHIMNHYGHELSGLFAYNIFTSIIVAFVFHHIIRNPLLDNLPQFLYQRLARYQTFNWSAYFRQHYFIVIFSIFFGNLSHLFWDAFTHPHGFFVTHLIWLQTQLQIGSLTLPLYKILQHSSSIIGMTCIFGFILLLPKTTLSTHHIDPKYWLTLIILSLLIVTTRVLINSNGLLIGNLIASSIMALFISCIITAILPNYVHKQQN